MWLSELKTTDLRSDTKHVFVVSLGSTEQHGPFAPLGSDTYIQDAILKSVERILKKVIFLPTVPITHSTEHLGFMGTVTLEGDTLYAVMRDIANSLKESAKTLLFVSWHGGNKKTIDRFIESEQANFDTVELKQITIGDEKIDQVAEKLLGGPIDEHAGNAEVSLMLAVRPDLVRVPSPKEAKKPIAFSWDQPVKEVSKDGVIDNHPKWVVSEEIGNKLLDLYAANLVAKIRKYQ